MDAALPEGFVFEDDQAPAPAQVQPAGSDQYLQGLGLPAGYVPSGKDYDALQPHIKTASSTYGVPEHIVKGIVWKESNYHPDIVYGKRVGGSGDSGAMQLIPGTAQSMGVKNVFDPADNINGGVKYLKTLYDELGDWGKAVAAYNSGEAHRLFSSNKQAAVWDAPNFANYVAPVFDTAGKFARADGKNVPAPGADGTIPAGFVLESAQPENKPTGTVRPVAQFSAPTSEQQAGWGKPKPDVAANHDPAEYGTLQRAAFAKDPQTAFKIFAASRFPDEPNAWRRYGVNEYGRIYYRDNSGTEYEEIPEGFENWIKKTFAEGVSDVPEMAGATVGALAGAGTPYSIPLAMIGAMPGRYLKERIGEYYGDRPRTPIETAANLAGAGVQAGVGQGIGGMGSAGAINKTLRAGTGPGVIGKLASRDLPYLDQAQLQRITDLARQFGIDLTAPESTGSPSLIALWNRAATTPGRAAEMVRQWGEKTRIPQLQEAIERELGNVSPESSVYQAGMQGAKTARTVQDIIEGAREEAASPYYREAYRTAPPVDTSNIVTRIDDMIASEPEGRVKSVLQKMRKGFFREETPDEVDARVQQMLQGGGNNIGSQNGALTLDVTPRMVPETNLEKLHKIKSQELDTLIGEMQGGTPAQKTAERYATEIKNSLQGSLKSASPEYGMANDVYQAMSRPLNDFLYKNPDLMPKDPRAASLVARIAALPEGRFAEAPEILFGPNSSPEMVTHAKAFIQHADPDTWDGLIRSHLQKKFEGMKFGDPMTVGDRLRDKVFGTPHQEAMLKSAMDPQQFQRWSDFMDLLDVTNRIVYRNSLTSQQLATGQMMEREASGYLGKSMGWFSRRISPARAADELGKMNLPEYSAKVVEALKDPQMRQRIAQVKQLSNGQEKAVQTLGLLGSIYGENSGVRYLTAPKNIEPLYNPQTEAAER